LGCAVHPLAPFPTHRAMQEDGGLSNLRCYQALGLHRTDATPEEVKRAYKRLSLKYHPDRNRDDPAATSKFQEIATAYGVLSSPRKRQIYDAYGDQGLKMYESYMSFADSDDEGSKMPLQPVTMLLVVCVGISVLIFMMAAFGVLLLLYLGDSMHPPLALVFLPLWVVFAGGLCCLCVSMAGSPGTRGSVALTTLQLVCVVVFMVLLCVRVDGVKTLSYAAVFTPLYVLEATSALQVCAHRAPAHPSRPCAGALRAPPHRRTAAPPRRRAAAPPHALASRRA